MADGNDQGAKGWTVLDQEQTVGRLPDRSYGPVMRVTFKTAAGVVRSLDVPVADYSAARVTELVEAAAAETDAVQNL